MDHPTDLLLLFLTGDLDADRSRDVTRHLEGCARCRAELQELREMHEALSRLPSLPLPEAFAERVRARLQIASSRALSWQRMALAACVLVAIGAAAGWAAGRATAPAPLIRDGEPKQALVLYEPTTLAASPAEERRRQVGEFRDWLRPLSAAGVVLGGAPLSEPANPPAEPVSCSGPNATVRLLGMIVVRATRDEALQMAARSPFQKYGGAVLVRQIQ